MDKMPSPGDMSDQGHQWLEHFKSEFDSKSFCDATLVSAEGKEFHVHRIILATRSPYFRALFTSPLGGDQAPVLDKITLPDIDSCTLQTILNYIYTGTLKEITEATFVPVIRALDRLQVDGGLHLCHQALIRAINRTNCVIIFQLSRTYFAPTVETESKSFLLREFTTIPSHILDELDGPEFYELISDDRLNVRREEQTFEAIKCWTAANQAERMTFFSPLLKMVRFGNAGLRFIENIVLNDPLVQLDATLKPYLEGAQAVLYDIQANPLPSKFDIVAHPFLRPRIPRDIIFVFGGWSASSASSVLESYDCRVNKWYQATVPDSRPRAYHGMVNFNGSIYIVGGFDGRNHFSSVSAFDPSTKKWTIRANMNQARCYVSVAALDGHVFAIGGYDGQNRTESTERYNPVENQWTLVASMNQQRSDAAACSA
ncbi:Kelch-like protein 10 [Halotydeus destructor]|nr:Kelch-like protein 10 [Halotydeus destructor]